MNIMTKFELKKIIRRKSTIIGVIVLFVLLTTSFLIQLLSEVYGGTYKGVDAISKRREEFNNISRLLNRR